MRQARHALVILALTLMIALAGCTMPDEAGEPDAEGAAGEAGPGDAERPPRNVTVDATAKGDAPATTAASVERGDARVVADLDLSRAQADTPDEPITVSLRFTDPDGNVLLERAVELHPGHSTHVKTEASLGGLTNWWNTHPDAEWAAVTLEIVPDAGSVDASGFYGVPG